ncbi:DnaJ domain containing protein [Nitzschia inconspicua]|uniref:DnaJ domain containing protein n=1 Tax=Nitzschia inconspicua TaxID=303405 RepID=A0A9K3LGD4_9STRA|nr:DnaJ domain containing protein [Nitzschia inconspicua]
MKTLRTKSKLVAIVACASSSDAARGNASSTYAPPDGGTPTSNFKPQLVVTRKGQQMNPFSICESKVFPVDSSSSIPVKCHIPWMVTRGGGTDPPNGSENKNETGSPLDKSEKVPQNKKKKKKKASHRKRQTSTTEESSDTDANATGPSSNNVVVEEILKHEDFYSILGVPKTASDRDITKAYRRRCVQTHPDKTGGDRRAFDRVAEAYDVLSDEQKRHLYDRFGKAGVGQDGLGGAAAGTYQDIFRSMFQQASQQRQKQQRRNASLRYQLQVTLEDMYYGRTQSVMVNPPNTFHPQRHSGRRKQKKVDVHIPKGSINGQSIVLSGEVDFNDDMTPGDLIFVLTQAAHPTFTRKGHDLAMELSIGLEEALCGLQRPILHLSGKELWVESARTEKGSPLIIQTGDVQVLKGWGMPKRNSSGEFGDLYVQYRVEMPKGKNGDVLSESEMQELSHLLTKLQGTNKLLSQRGKQTKPRTRKVSNKSRDEVDEEEEQENQQESTNEIHTLLDAKPSDFGTASGKVTWEDEEDFHGHDSGESFHPFSSAASSFFGSTSGDARSSYFFGNFGTPQHDEDGNVQCQQM